MIFIYICLFIVGIVFGSFFNVVGLRLPKNESLISPRSHCVNCNHILDWYELIPVFSYLFLKGKCRKCKQKISMQYPLIEIIILFKFFYFWLYYRNYLINCFSIYGSNYNNIRLQIYGYTRRSITFYNFNIYNCIPYNWGIFISIT